MTIGQLARESGVRTDTIRYYETLKLIEPVSRTNAGYRLYDVSSKNRVAFIKKAKSLGFKLSEIQVLIKIKTSKKGKAEEMLNLTNEKIAEAQKKIEDLITMKRTLKNLASECPGGDFPASECPILNYLYSDKTTEGGAND